MSIGAGLLITALGAIFTFAIRHSPRGLDLHVVGVVLMSVGAIGIYLRMAGYGPSTNIITVPRWTRVRPRRRLIEEEVYDPMAADPTVYRREVDTLTATAMPAGSPDGAPLAGPDTGPIIAAPTVRPVTTETEIRRGG